MGWGSFYVTKAEAPILWPPDVNSHLTGKDPDAGKDRGQEGKRATKDEMLGCDALTLKRKDTLSARGWPP